MRRRNELLKTGKTGRDMVPVPAAPSDSTPPTRGEWDILPPEIQEIILKKVEARKDLLSCRQVNIAWKEVADKSLEKQSLSLWTTWNPFEGPVLLRSQSLNTVPVMKLCRIWSGTAGQDLKLSVRWNHSSLPVVENPNLGSPFPTNSMQIIIPTTSNFGPNRELMVKQLFISYGHHLTQIVLSDFTAQFDYLSKILQPMSNLKALTLKDVCLQRRSYAAFVNTNPSLRFRLKLVMEEDLTPSYIVNEEPSCLPSLPNLTYLKLESCKGNMIELLLNSYGGQLLSLETGGYIRPCLKHFTNLKELKLTEYNNFFLQVKPSQLPALQYLAEIHTGLRKLYPWKVFLQAIISLPKTLVHLHLDIALVDDESEEMENLVLKDTFPFLKKLGLVYPSNERQAERVGRLLLHGFPNLERLHLMRYHFDGRYYIEKVIATAGFWNRCSKLRKIFLHKGGTPETFFELSRP